MRAAPFLALLVLGLAASARLGAEPPKPEFLPKLFGPGEAVRATLLLPGIEAASGFSLAPGQGLPASEDPELLDASLAKGSRGWELSILFVPWSPGPGRIPAMTLRGLALPAIPYATRSRLGAEDRELSPPRPQREPPGSGLYLYGIAGAALLLVLASVFSIAYLVPAGRALAARWRSGLAFRRLSKSLDFLEEGAASSEPPAFYAALSRALRLYLGERVDERAPALTARELAALPSSAFPAPGLRESAAGVFGEAELARYAGLRPRPEAMAASVRRARELAQAAEEALDARL